ncbi:MAG TPA: EAL domain-containing protein [Candidatus Limnocylindria bacterium]|nr:EAL domain-containing protein [Candidatus Limnocylindria bacterium]
MTALPQRFARSRGVLPEWRGTNGRLTAIVVVGLASSAALLLAAFADPLRAPILGQLGVVLAGMVVMLAILGGARRASPQNRRVRLHAASIGLLLLVLQGTVLADRFGMHVPPVASWTLIAMIAVAVAVTWRAALRGRFSLVDEVAVYLDSAALFLVAACTTVLWLGAAVHPTPDPMALTMAALFAGILGGVTMLYLVLTPVRRQAGWALLASGFPIIGAGFALRATGGAGPLADLLVGTGWLVAGGGAATLRMEVDSSPAFQRVARAFRAVLPIAAVSVAAGLIVLGEVVFSGVDTAIELWIDVGLGSLLLVGVGRQTMLLWERDRMLAAVQRAAMREHALMAEVQASERRFRTLVQNSSDVFLILAKDGTVAYQSPAVERVLGYAPTDRGQVIFEYAHPDDVAALRAILAEIAATPHAQRTMELRVRHDDGTWRTIEATGTNLLDDPVIEGIVVNYRDVTERRRLEAQLIHEAFHDPLTGLPNRVLFADRVGLALSRRASFDRVAVLFIDLDDFKTINDSLGHSAGDQLLAAVARRISETVRPEDTVSRFGGDEFAILLDDADPGIAGRVAGRLLEAIGLPFDLDGKQVHLEASIGVAFSADPADGAGELLRNADVAMYEAKARGKGRVELFEASMHAAVLKRLELKADLDHAIERHELRLRYQPIFALDSGELDGFEALLRWRHPVRGEIPPGDFIPLAEETGLIVTIGRWVLEQAVAQAAAWNAGSDRRIGISVNLSARQLRERELVPWVRDTLQAAQLDPELLTLELTETGIMLDDEQRLRELRQLGVQLALDDFGTGYSSLSYLSRFPINVLKIDRSFIALMGEGTEDPIIVSSVIQLGRALGMATVAEGIERPEQLSRLRALGVGFGQGYLLSRPMDAIKATRFVSGGETLDRLVS